MSKFSISFQGVQNVIDMQQKIEKMLADLREDAADVKSGLSFKVAARADIEKRLAQIDKSIEKIQKSKASLRTALADVSDKYRITEIKLSGVKININSDLAAEAEEKQGKPVEGSVLSGSWDANGTVAGISAAAGASGSILHGKAYAAASASNSYLKGEKNGSFGASAAAGASGSVAEGEISGKLGYLYGEASGEFLAGEADAEARAIWMQDGKFNPSLYVGAGAAATVAHGAVSCGLGSDALGAGIDLDGEFLHAEAGAAVGVGALEVDEDGNTVYGVKAEAGAIAYVAKGSGDVGISIPGIDISVGGSVYAGSIGGEVGGEITANGVSLDLGLAAAMGIGLELNIDWSDAIEATGEALESISDFVPLDFNWFD